MDTHSICLLEWISFKIFHISVLEHTGIPVTGIPPISQSSNYFHFSSHGFLSIFNFLKTCDYHPTLPPVIGGPVGSSFFFLVVVTQKLALILLLNMDLFLEFMVSTYIFGVGMNTALD